MEITPLGDSSGGTPDVIGSFDGCKLLSWVPLLFTQLEYSFYFLKNDNIPIHFNAFNPVKKEILQLIFYKPHKIFNWIVPVPNLVVGDDKPGGQNLPGQHQVPVRQGGEDGPVWSPPFSLHERESQGNNSSLVPAHDDIQLQNKI